MPLPQVTDPLLVSGQQQGENYLNANAASNLGALSKFFGRYNMNPQAYMQSAGGVVDTSRLNSLSNLHTRLREQQIMADQYNQRMESMWQYYKNQQLEEKQGMWGAGLGALGSITGGIMGGLQGRSRRAPTGSATSMTPDPSPYF